jgi:hypothetical protein
MKLLKKIIIVQKKTQKGQKHFNGTKNENQHGVVKNPESV